MFEWDPDKATSNRRKHGISFEQASEAFKDPFAIELIDDRFAYDEPRYVLIGRAGGRLLTIAFSERGGDDADHIGAAIGPARKAAIP